MQVFFMKRDFKCNLSIFRVTTSITGFAKTNKAQKRLFLSFVCLFIELAIFKKRFPSVSKDFYSGCVQHIPYQ